MNYYNHYRRRLRFGYSWTKGVRAIIILNVIIYGFMLLSGAEKQIYYLFGLVPADVFTKLHVWQFFTYMFLHGGFFHLLFNMFVLWMFGSIIEREMGTKEFLKYYIITGLGAGIFNWLFSFHSQTPIIGASGATYGVLIAFAMFFPNAIIYLYFVIPVKAKYIAIGAAAIEFLLSFNKGSGIAHLAHLGGMLVGFVYIKYGSRISRLWESKPKSIRRSNDYIKSKISSIPTSFTNPEEEFTEEDLTKNRDKIINLVDIILDKINKEGYNSLSEQEKRILKQASEILSEKNDE